MNPASSSTIRVVLIDDSPIIRLGLKSALEDYADIVIVGEAGSAADGLRAIDSLQPDVISLDLHLPDRSGLEVCRSVHASCPQTRVVFLTSDGTPAHVQAAFAAGAVGYLLKENDGATLASALRDAFRGKQILDRTLSNGVRSVLVPDTARNHAAAQLAQLTQQEQRVVALLAGGLTNREIGEQLGLTEKTVKNYLAAIFTKLDIERRTQAAALYVASRR